MAKVQYVYVVVLVMCGKQYSPRYSIGFSLLWERLCFLMSTVKRTSFSADAKMDRTVVVHILTFFVFFFKFMNDTQF